MSANERATEAADFVLIGAGFFGYAREIIAKLRLRGREVLWFEDRPSTDTFTKATLRLAPALLAGRSEGYFKQIADGLRGRRIRDVLVIKGEAMSPAAIRYLRAALPDATFTLYFWDGYRNMPADSRDKVTLFDRAFTFDSADARADTRLTYRPLFFLDEYAHLPPVSQDIDLLFFGTAHSDRYSVLKRLARAVPPRLRFEKLLYFPSRSVYRFRRVFDPRLRGARRDEFIFQPLGKSAILQLVARSRAVVDIERTIQTGLTMRTVETLGAGRKLITTNPTVSEADFYHPDNIAIIDRDRPSVPDTFFERPYVAPAAELLQRYSLSGWIDEVIP
jgi:hypothetical protein